MSQTAKSASSQGTDAKDKGAPAPAASSKATKTGEPGMGSYRVSPSVIYLYTSHSISVCVTIFIDLLQIKVYFIAVYGV